MCNRSTLSPPPAVGDDLARRRDSIVAEGGSHVKTKNMQVDRVLGSGHVGLWRKISEDRLAAVVELYFTK